MEFFTYILISESSNRYYVGHTSDLKKRLLDHNSGKVKSTKNLGPWRLIYKKSFETRSMAYKNEMKIKGKKSRKYIDALILEYTRE